MNRRDALLSLAGLAGAAGISMTPVMTHEADAVTMVVFRSTRMMSLSERARLRDLWKLATEGTALEHVKTVVLDGNVEVEFVRGRT